MSCVRHSYQDLAHRLAGLAGGCSLVSDRNGLRLSPVIANTLMPIVVGRDCSIRLGGRDCSESQIADLLAGLKRVEQRSPVGRAVP
jgi:hypothetical protein